MGKVVCVTGASGYVASWLVKLLLNHGYTVKGTVRNLSDPNKVAHLKAFEGAKERLHLFEANLTEHGSFDSIVDGCDGVFHTASPVMAMDAISDPQAELIEPAVEGTLNVLKSCSKAASVKRVVVTSSVAAVICNRKPQGPDVVVDETWFSDPEFCKETKKWYWLAKTLAEEAAWKYAEENGINLLVINPGFVIGPLLQPTLNATSQHILYLLKGKEILPDYQFIDVRDVAHAHILVFENPSTTGRYILVEQSINCFEALQILRNLYPSLNIPNNVAGSPTFQVSKTKAQVLGINFTPLEVSLKDTIDSLIEKNFLEL
ncbi:hypothetical protein BUALT_Bualt19G0042400 [Buddleja alternifolia]|uniref:Dihydroflavonol 4-reductase n=1 Tax=Buddleja alternifolia TaxID=168488 RepID=A0AAV6W9E8_9LAMI|nr:hypothetical protein BUALT_Bualt19G0042400 [Buddleja alternifolia]